MYAVERLAWQAARCVMAAALAAAPALPVHAADGGAGVAFAGCPPLLHHTFNSLQTGAPQSLCQYAGRVVLVVNTASYCGYTSQYEGLEALYRKYRERGLVVLGFPSNDFGAQEPGTNKEVAEFCRSTYGVEFPMFEKSSLAPPEAHPLYAQLAEKTGRAPRWNFHKYVVDRTGTYVVSFDSRVTPDSREFVGLIEKLLAEKGAPGKS
ncbi:MAG TPA: glutathione peroxidase [Casimicrobiaceae bacterium]|nr:glutathione peroxidase [Casimicrobiaceae bacterium]